MKKICFLTNKYPNEFEENALVFLQQLIWEVSDIGTDCEVICPVPVNISLKYFHLPEEVEEKTDNGATVKVYFPKYISFGQSFIGNYNPAKITTNNFTKAVDKVIKKMKSKPDAIYGHFVTPAGIAASRIGKKYNIPSFLAYGEATLNTIRHFGEDNVKNELSSLSGVVSVSTQNKNILSSKSIISSEKIGVFPNGYRSERFYSRDKNESREKLGLPRDKFIVSFVGSYDHRKGIKRLEKAVDTLEDVYFISAGKGVLEPKSSKCLYSGSVANEDLPYFYSASDAFVLPTLNEGCSNAIVEAIACGLPIVSSNLPFNEDILNETNAILIEPNSIDEIKSAIKFLKENNEMLRSLQNGSLEKSKELTLNTRANNILDFIEEKTEMYM